MGTVKPPSESFQYIASKRSLIKVPEIDWEKNVLKLEGNVVQFLSESKKKGGGEKEGRKETWDASNFP